MNFNLLINNASKVPNLNAIQTIIRIHLKKFWTQEFIFRKSFIKKWTTRNHRRVDFFNQSLIIFTRGNNESNFFWITIFEINWWFLWKRERIFNSSNWWVFKKNIRIDRKFKIRYLTTIIKKEKSILRTF